MRIAVIGSGISGLACAAAMSARGHQVVVFEQYKKIGGYAHSFFRKKFQFHSSVHAFPGTVYQYLSLLNIKYDRNGMIPYRMLYQFEDRYQFIASNHIAQQLAGVFPGNKESLEGFFQEVNDAYKIFIKLDVVKGDIFKLKAAELKHFIQFSKSTVKDLLVKYFPADEDMEVRNIILALVDLSPDSTALLLPITINEIKQDVVEYMISGGAPTILNDLRSVILDSGGEIRCNEKLEKIHVVDREVKALTTRKGEFTNFDYVISSVDIVQVYNTILDGVSKEKMDSLKKSIADFEPSDSSATVWLGLNCPPEKLGISDIVCYYPKISTIESKRRYFNQDKYARLDKDNIHLLIIPTFSFDPKSTPANKSQLCLGLNVPFSIENTWYEQDNAEYQQRKKEIVELFVSLTEEVIPDLRKYIEVVECATPRTYERYTLNPKGASVGFAKTTAYVTSQNKPREYDEYFKNLLFTGSWVSDFSGVFGTIDVGFRTANKLLELLGEEQYSLPKRTVM
ncbi:NAD(P)/FAD-dependent oxidoreductase [Paenibacillus albiflavus]|uniref:NAD(P)/FAD-dependent oxidoreductase n=1 Tax=Paenibacillus albiflavus TaxID=2545760 RepID=A0A4R4ED97_9BACL|nr:NAD(P)/FAD-dependent oxidoreductase [Paenibacillus albiflavus]TCZ77173.1 NAD(P)/FAD-dependent oxidoreductase [Paenibacillus albiflavus]